MNIEEIMTTMMIMMMMTMVVALLRMCGMAAWPAHRPQVQGLD